MPLNSRRLYNADVTKGLDSAEDLVVGTFQQRSRYQDRYSLLLAVDKMGRRVDEGFSLLHRPLQGTVALAHVRTEDLPAVTADSFTAQNTGNLLGSLVERCDPPLVIDGKDSVRDALQDNFVGDAGNALLFFHVIPAINQPRSPPTAALLYLAKNRRLLSAEPNPLHWYDS